MWFKRFHARVRSRQAGIQPARSGQGGFTLVELLVVIAIIGVLVGLLLPAVQTARESSRRRACSSKMKQLGLALLTYEDAFKQLPKGSSSTQRFTQTQAAPAVREWTNALHYLLPFMEETDYYVVLGGPSFTTVLDPTSNAWPVAARGKSVAGWLCPSDTGPILVDMQGLVPSLTTQQKLARSNYIGIFSGLRDGDNFNNVGWGAPITPATNLRAAFGSQWNVRMSEIADGTSKTMAFGEYIRGLSEGKDVRGALVSNRSGHKFLYVTLQPNSKTGDRLLNGQNWCPSEFNVWPAACNQTGDGLTDYASPRSRHPGGVLAVVCDGSVRFVEDNIDLAPWRNFGFIADGG